MSCFFSSPLGKARQLWHAEKENGRPGIDVFLRAKTGEVRMAIRAAWCAVLCGAVAEAADGTSDIVRSYRGQDGQQVHVVLLSADRRGAALVQVLKSTSTVDGLVLDATLSTDGTRFETRLEGSPWTVLQVKDGKGEAFVPQVKSFAVTFDEKAIASIDSKALLTLQASQRESGALTLAAKKPFPFLTKKYEAKAAAAWGEVQKRCKTNASFRYEWASFSDDDMENVDVFKVCAPIFDGVLRKCDSVKSVTAVSCKMATAFSLETSQGQMVFSTTAAASGAAQFMKGKVP
jgi:hypothetical protein